jgi:hypothetical protein
MRAVGHNPLEFVGDSVSDGFSGRITDPVTGAGLFNPNLDPAEVGQDEDGNEYAAGTDMSFGSAIRRQMHTNVINGDFSVLPPGGVDSLIVSDQNDADFNPLPGWTWTPATDGSQTLQVTADAAFASGYKLTAYANGLGSTKGTLDQWVAIPISQGQQYRVLLSMYGPNGSYSDTFDYRYYKADAATAAGLNVSVSPVAGGSTTETKVDAGLVPTNAAYIRVRLVVGNVVGSRSYAEVRCAFLPAEATLGLGSISAQSSAITNTETAVKSVIIPANTFVVGSVYRVTLYATVTSTVSNVVTTRCRIGPTTLTGAIVAYTAPAATSSASADPYEVQVLITVRSVGAAGTVMAQLRRTNSPSQPFSTTPYSVEGGTGTTTIDTTVANLIEMTIVTAAGTTTVRAQQCVIECVMAS